MLFPHLGFGGLGLKTLGLEGFLSLRVIYDGFRLSFRAEGFGDWDLGVWFWRFGKELRHAA